jgi:acetyltransferase-like isoleucine patch superfamily enzyme
VHKSQGENIAKKKHRFTLSLLRRNWIYCSAVYAVNLAGHIHIHSIRHGIYRHIFKIVFPKDSIIYSNVHFESPWLLKIGHNSIVNDHARLDARNGIVIGNNVDVSTDVRIFTIEHDPDSPTFGTKGGPVKIEDWVYIGHGATILPGVTIREGAVVACGAVVTKDVESWTMVGGIPAKFIKKRPQVRYTQNTKDKGLFE